MATKLLTTLDSRAERNWPAGQNATGNLQVPDGTLTFDIALTQPGWPSVSDGTIKIAALVSRQNGPFTEEWSDTFEHQQVLKGGVPVVDLHFGCTIQAPLATGDRMRVEFTSANAFRSALSVAAG
jgi:hypothetical protein